MFFKIFFLIFMIFMCIERLFELYCWREKEDGIIEARWTFRTLLIVHILIFISVFVEYFTKKPEIIFFITIIGLFMFSLGLIGRNWTIRTLGKLHSVHIEIRENHKLIIEGPYKYVRNPYYLSVLLEVLGFPLVANAYYSFLVSVFIYSPLIFLRTYYEEKTFEKKFGEEYVRYKNEINAFIPFKKRRSLVCN
ncbi:MAG: hypothetical protein A2043_04030 [Candidatus Schekmanbacteria bacterium GWA2_38_9]|uniref:Uncharacterized protein n=1 Tax=Candidatus Schekmanbacteria bacterium RIFCSPLOWO2_12_FULL_38_15 TaxID=1817883 RepID=A0A1F7SI41_9BACT|nr:MAG: hypothetical protein A2043_04030 [Candidatus Schekmanbacteria bacterium GWA2_38_9]OGL50818.1 MAG: hypothetical protein A3H37_03130 [Candidatus Schekmanbacteria bacterium RIFCSPLOWO2_02_FULL_38_14]OGL53421.1 MAG: hypothetical protein A3G31_07935 [Candidatus Schekmanbacteria bacterium RIFCSPLOWO2_12_FULL_38_15]